TKGDLRVQRIVPLDGVPSAEVLRLAASLEQHSEHPIGRAIVREAERIGVAASGPADFQALPGLGAQGLVGTERVVVGSHRFFEARGMCTAAAHSAIEELGEDGAGGVLVGVSGRAVGVIGVSDQPREAARGAIEMLRSHDVDHIALLTGDHETTARLLASDLGLDGWRANLMPEDKVAAVNELRAAHGPVAMVGDGVNDAPALATADVGIAMGVAGTHAALETADVALMSDELAKIPYALRLSRATSRNIRVNIAFSLALKAAFLVMAIAGSATLWMAVVADTGASLIVIANALRLLRE
ncbi:MAG TPA: HAD-IC family P-type ATPase, partial [Vicinamibacterales bacterium]|nr:HAD-IC family P-type ATPase [Vicinamibacterales bacterium]